jgi:hypothetical protein
MKRRPCRKPKENERMKKAASAAFLFYPCRARQLLQQGVDQHAFPLGIPLSVLGKSGGQLPFEGVISRRPLRLGSKIISKIEVVFPGFSPIFHPVNMAIPGILFKIPRDKQQLTRHVLSPENNAPFLQRRQKGAGFLQSAEAYDQIHNGLGAYAGNRCAAHVLDIRRRFAQNLFQNFRRFLGFFRPFRPPSLQPHLPSL